MTATWLGLLPAPFLVVALVLITRWVVILHRRLNDHAERIAHLEGQLDTEKGRP